MPVKAMLILFHLVKNRIPQKCFLLLLHHFLIRKRLNQKVDVRTRFRPGCTHGYSTPFCIASGVVDRSTILHKVLYLELTNCAFFFLGYPSGDPVFNCSSSVSHNLAPQVASPTALVSESYLVATSDGAETTYQPFSETALLDASPESAHNTEMARVPCSCKTLHMELEMTLVCTSPTTLDLISPTIPLQHCSHVLTSLRAYRGMEAVLRFTSLPPTPAPLPLFLPIFSVTHL